ncbi:Mig-14 family protein [Enterobacter hormaechei]|uniref:GNAT family N-acetyltransferase n=1 Tax=Enterobacter asburiae TaxID=61645 RepID=UPI002A4F58C6|nr:Mig-14 family protein [Enterobacter hormaechei]
MRKIITNLSGWEKTDNKTYAECHELYGSSFINNPETLEFLHDRLPCYPEYYVRHDNNGIKLGAFCTWKGRYLAGEQSISNEIGNNYPFSKDELILPLHPKLVSVIPYKTKHLSSIHRLNVINSTFKFNSNRGICISKGCGLDGFSSKTKNRRNNELHRFLNAGGKVIDQSLFSPGELTEIFTELYENRWGHHIKNTSFILDSLENLRHLFFGFVLFFNEKPCAFQLITKSESPCWINFDYINGGYNQTQKSFCPGTIVTWLNVKSAYELCMLQGKEMRYSFGRPTAEYKNRWCRTEPLGRVY